VRWLGKRWRTLHQVGVHWLWFVFAFSYSGRVAAGKLEFVPLAGLAFAALGLRIAAWRRRARLRG
jgi:methionine sulfoxide reductase heme-binding subunit